MKLNTSPYYILVFLSRQGFILLTLPLQTFLLKNSNSYLTVYVYLFNLFLIIFLVIFGCLSQKNLKLTLKNKKILLEKGVIIKSRILVSKHTISVISATQTPFQQLLKIYKVSLVSSKKQLTLYLSKKLLPLISNSFSRQKDTARLIFRNGFIPTFFLSSGFYNAFTGALTIIPVLKRITYITSPSQIQKQTLDTIKAATYHQGLTFILNAVISGIIGLWGVGVLITLLGYYGLSVYKKGAFAEIRRGLFVKRRITANTENISAVVFRQNILMAMLHRYTGEFRIACDSKANKLTFVCSESHKRCLAVVFLLGKFISHPKDEKLRPHNKALLSYTRLPILCLLAFSVFTVTADIYSPYVSKTRFGLFVTLWLGVWLIFRVMVFKRCFISFDSDTLLVCTYSGMTFCKVYIPANKILSLKLTESLFQKRLGTCSLSVQIKNRKPLSFKIRHIDRKKTAELIEKLCGNNF